MYQVYSRRSPQIGRRVGPRSSICSRSSRMYCCSFFQLSSRRATTCFMNASRSLCAETAPAPVQTAARHRPSLDSRRTGWENTVWVLSGSYELGIKNLEFGMRTRIPNSKFLILLRRADSAEDEFLQHVGARFFIRPDPGHQVDDRQHPAVGAARIDDHQVIAAVLLHQTQAVVQRLVWCDGHEAGAHDLADAHPRGAPVLGGDFIGDVALRDDADELVEDVEDPDRPHTALAQIARGVVHRRVFANGEDARPRADQVEDGHVVLLPTLNSHDYCC